MTRQRLLLAGALVAVAVLVAVGLWVVPRHRRVDGRTGAEWLALAQQATRGTMYAAEGESTVGARHIRFALDQHRDGRYVMRELGGAAPGELSYDGQGTCFEQRGRCERAEAAGAAPATCGCVALLGTGEVAGRPVVRLRARQNGVRKDIAVDRETGVMLAMTTRHGRGEASRMALTRIEYRDVALPAAGAPADTPALRAVSGAQAAAALGGRVLVPGWLPTGYTLRGVYMRDCGTCADMRMVALRYGDGTGSFTLFETTGAARCAREADGKCCCIASSGALTTTRTIGAVTATAIAGGPDAKTLARIADSLREAPTP